MYVPFLIQLTTLYDEYIDRPNLTEQKNPFEDLVPPYPLEWGSEHKKNIKVSLKQISQF